MRLRSTWAERRRTSASSREGGPGAATVAKWAAFRCGCRWSTSTRSVPAAARSSGGTTAAPCASARRAPGRPRPGVLRARRYGSDRHRRQPPVRAACRRVCPAGSSSMLAAAERALGDIDPAAVVEVVNAEMLRALRVVSVERGHDPRDFALVAFGGAGPLHACALADELGCRKVLVPDAAGVFSALGLAASDERRDHVAPYVRPLTEVDPPPGDGEASLRYRGQSFELTFRWATSSRSAFIGPTRSATATPTGRARSSSWPCVRSRSCPAPPLRPRCGGRTLRRPGRPLVELAGRDVLGAGRLVRSDRCTRDARAGAAVVTGAIVPVELQVIGSALRAIAEEMGAVLIRAAFSSNIKERRDCSTALFDAAGRMVVQAEHIPVHLGAMPEAVAAVMERRPADGRGMGAERSVHRGHPPSGYHAGLAHGARVRRQPGSSRGCRGHGAGKLARQLARALPGRADHPADAPRRWAARPDRGQLEEPGRTARRSSRAARRPAAGGGTHGRARRPAWAGASRGRDGRAPRLLRAARAGRYRRPAGRTLRGAGRDRGRRRRSRDPRRRVDRRRRGRDRLRRARRRSIRATSTARSRSRARPCFFVVRLVTEPDIPASGGAFAPVTVRAPVARSSTRVPPPQSSPGIRRRRAGSPTSSWRRSDRRWRCRRRARER